MSDKKIISPFDVHSIEKSLARGDVRRFHPKNLIEYFGTVNYATNERVLTAIKQVLLRQPSEELTLIVTSTGGPTGSAMSFYDTVRYVLRPNLTTIGSGDVDSSGVLLFLAGERRYVTKHTTMLLHCAARVFEPGKRINAGELSAMAHEDLLKDEQYAGVLVDRSGGMLTQEKALALMAYNTVLTPGELIELGLIHGILG